MRVLAFDPGYDRLGVAVLDKIDNKEVLLFSDCINTDKKSELNDRLCIIGQAVKTLIKEQKPEAVAIETLFFNKNVKTAIGVAEVRGIIIFLAKDAGLEVFEYSPQQIKVAVTGYGAGDKTAVYTMIKRLVKNIPDGALDDEYDAIATGITFLAHIR